MPATGTKPDIYALMNAYGLLEVPYKATTGEIRRAFRQLASLHHPDKFPEGSPDRGRATERMIQLNAAYELIRAAPLQYHRVSTATGADEPWSDAELEEAIRRGHAARQVEEFMTGATFAVFFALTMLLRIPHLYNPIAGSAGYIVAAIVVCGALGALMGRRSLVLRFVDQVLILLRGVLR